MPVKTSISPVTSTVFKAPDKVPKSSDKNLGSGYFLAIHGRYLHGIKSFSQLNSLTGSIYFVYKYLQGLLFFSSRV